MDKNALIEMLNKDLADEHASVIRYLIHAYQAGEDTPLGSMMLSMAREEMWHMDWLADEIGEMGAEPEMKQGLYPHDPTSNASLLRSYIEWEDNLVEAYARQAELVDSPEIKKILLQQSYESATHSKRFAKMLASLGPEGEEPLVYEDTGGFSSKLVERMKREMTDEYRLVLQHLRHSFVFEEESCPVGSELELTAMRHMKHLSHFAEELAEAGHDLDFVHPTLDMSREIAPALQSDVALTREARDRFAELRQDPELDEHRGLKIELDHMVSQEAFLASTVAGLMDEVEEPPTKPEPVPPEEPADGPDADAVAGFTVGSLIDK
jgi:bacterioferritin